MSDMFLTRYVITLSMQIREKKRPRQSGLECDMLTDVNQELNYSLGRMFRVRAGNVMLSGHALFGKVKSLLQNFYPEFKFSYLK